MSATLHRSSVLTVAAAIAAALFSAAYCLGAQAVKVFNPSFEQPVVTDPSGIARAPDAAAQGAGPGDSPWVFSAGSGIAVKGAIFNSQSSVPSTVPTPPDGNQWEYLEPGQESVSQVLTFPAAGHYTLTFDAVLSPSIAVWVDNNSLVALTLGASSSSSYSAFSGSFDVSAGGHTLTFEGPVELLGPEPQPPNLIDAVTIVPEPTCCAMLLPLMLLRTRRPRCPPSRPHAVA